MQEKNTQQVDGAVEELQDGVKDNPEAIKDSQEAVEDDQEAVKESQEAQMAREPIKSKIGGQSLIEGVMMRGLDKSSMAVRRSDGRIDLQTWKSSSLTNPKWYRKTPFVRGSFNMVESLILGYKCLMKSADISMEGLEDEGDSAKKKADKEAKNAESEILDPTETTPDGVTDSEEVQEEAIPQEARRNNAEEEKPKEEKSSSGTGWIGLIGMILGVGIALLLFMMVPMWITRGIESILTLGGWKTAAEGIIKIIILVIYMWLMTLMKDTRRTFEYHGAEHKSIFCYESGKPLTVDNVKKCIRFHPRCGTSFILIVLIISILVTSIVTWNTLWLRLVIKIALLPLIVGISYEIIRLAGRYDNVVTRIISAPGLALQRITTKEPDDSQIEVAVAALKAVIPNDRDVDKW